MERPETPLKPDTLDWSLMEMSLQSEFDGKPGSADMTIQEISELMDKEPTKVRAIIGKIYKRTGYRVKYKRVGA